MDRVTYIYWFFDIQKQPFVYSKKKRKKKKRTAKQETPVLSRNQWVTVDQPANIGISQVFPIARFSGRSVEGK